MNEHYQKYKNLIGRRAWHWHIRTGYDFEELFAEGNVVYCNCLNDYNPDLSKFSTHLYNQLQYHYSIMFRNKPPRFCEINLNVIPVKTYVEKKICDKDILNKIYNYLGNSRDANIFKLYFSTDLSKKDVGFVFGITSERVRQIIDHKLLPKVRKRFKNILNLA